MCFTSKDLCCCFGDADMFGDLRSQGDGQTITPTSTCPGEPVLQSSDVTGLLP